MKLRVSFTAAAAAALLVATGIARGDPCGMVPPIVLDPSNPALTRTGVQTTFVFYKNGIEDIVLRPAFIGSVQEFGMLIPFPEPPAIRKAPDDVFTHVKLAIDPPRINPMPAPPTTGAAAPTDGAAAVERGPGTDTVRLLREEAVGMYQVAVLEAGSAKALDRWMTQHGYVYPEGMDAPCEDYVKAGWCFVAVKAKVGRKGGVTPRPGMRETDSSHASAFEGAVQAMGFRFRTKKPVVPMRLSAFNGGKLDNLVYVLADSAMRFDELPATMVERTLSGEKLLSHVTDPLPFVEWQDAHRWSYGTREQIAKLPAEQQKSLEADYAKVCERAAKDEWTKRRRDPTPKNGKAKLLFADDLLAAGEGRLSHPHEEREKELLAVGEALGLRGPLIDAAHAAAIETERMAALEGVLDELKGMTMTVIRGDFPRDVIAKKNLHLVAHATTPSETPRHGLGTPPSPAGERHGSVAPSTEENQGLVRFAAILAAVSIVVGFGLRFAAGEGIR